MASASDFIVVGHLCSVYGVRGWLKVRSYTEPKSNLFTYQPWFLMDRLGKSRGFEEFDSLHPVNIEQWQRHNKGFLVKIAGINDRQRAESLADLDVRVEKRHLPPLESGEYYWHQLQGLRVMSQFDNGETYLGKVEKLIPTGANDVLVVQADSDSIDRRERLIPYVINQYIKKVDIDSGYIYVDWDPEF